MRARHTALVALVYWAAALAAPSVASAHAQLEGTVPARGADVARAPGQVVFRFDEPVEGSFGAVRVFSAAGARVDAGDAFHPGGEGDRMGVHLKSGLPDGTYTATYRVISADGHPVSSGFVFSIGRPGRAPGATVAELAGRAGAGPVTSTAFGAVRAGQYAAIAVSLGALAFLWLTWLPALDRTATAETAWRRATGRFLQRVRAVLLGTGLAGLLTAAAGVALEAATAASVSFWSALRPSILREELSTRFGTVWGMGALVWLLALGLVAASLRVRGARAPILRPAQLGATGQAFPAPGALLRLATATVGLLALLPALGGHARTQAPAAVMLPANVAHVLAASLWVGGLVALVLAVPAATRSLEPADRSRLLSGLLDRFSPLAFWSVAALLTTGVVQGLVEVASVRHLADTAFGRAVLVKAVVLAGLVALGADNRRRSIPGLRVAVAGAQPPGPAGRRLRSALRAEIALAAVALAATGALSGYPPSTAAGAGPFSTTTRIGDAQLQLTADPARVGANEIHLYLLDPRTGVPYRKAKEIQLSAVLPAKSIGPLDAEPQIAGPGHYVAPAVVLGVPGRWTLRLTVRTSAFDEHTTQVEVPIP